MAANLQELRRPTGRAMLEAPSAAPIGSMPTVHVGMTTLQGFELAQRAAKVLAMSTLVPKEYQGNLPNCIIALNMAQRIGADPLQVMQNLTIVHGRPTWSAQFLIATFNSCGRFSALRYEFFGKPNTDDWGCRAVATEKSSGERLVGTDVTIAIAKAEGWYTRNGSKWKTMPQQMLMYRAAAWFVRAIAPELSMGLHTAEEIHDVYDADEVTPGAYAVTQTDPVDASPVDATADTVDTATGELFSAPPDADPSADDRYLDLRNALDQCQSQSDITRLVHDLSKAQKQDATLVAIIRAREAELKPGA